MTNRDFDADDARVLAEFCDLEALSQISNGGGVYNFYVENRREAYEEYKNSSVDVKKVGLNKHGRINFTKNPCVYLEDGINFRVMVDSYLCDYSEWKPWSPEAPMWQIQSLKDAVREKGKWSKFENEMMKMGYASRKDFISAPPQAICKSILEMEGE